MMNTYFKIPQSETPLYYNHKTGEIIQRESKPHYAAAFLLIANQIYCAPIRAIIDNSGAIMGAVNDLESKVLTPQEQHEINVHNAIARSDIIISVDDDFFSSLEPKQISNSASAPAAPAQTTLTETTEGAVEQAESDRDALSADTTEPTHKATRRASKHRKPLHLLLEEAKQDSLDQASPPVSSSSKNIIQNNSTRAALPSCKARKSKSTNKAACAKNEHAVPFSASEIAIAKVIILKDSAALVRSGRALPHQKVVVDEINKNNRYIVTRIFNTAYTVPFSDIESILNKPERYIEDELDELNNFQAFIKANAVTLRWYHGKDSSEFKFNYDNGHFDVKLLPKESCKRQFEHLTNTLCHQLKACGFSYKSLGFKAESTIDRFRFAFEFISDYLARKHFHLYSFNDYLKSI